MAHFVDSVPAFWWYIEAVLTALWWILTIKAAADQQYPLIPFWGCTFVFLTAVNSSIAVAVHYLA